MDAECACNLVYIPGAPVEVREQFLLVVAAAPHHGAGLSRWPEHFSHVLLVDNAVRERDGRLNDVP